MLIVTYGKKMYGAHMLNCLFVGRAMAIRSKNHLREKTLHATAAHPAE